MREFVYKFLVIIVGIFFLYQFTIGYTINKFEQKFYSINVKEYSNFFKEKVRKEINNALKKDRIFSKDDATIIKNFIDKINKELNN